MTPCLPSHACTCIHHICKVYGCKAYAYVKHGIISRVSSRGKTGGGGSVIWGGLNSGSVGGGGGIIPPLIFSDTEISNESWMCTYAILQPWIVTQAWRSPPPDWSNQVSTGIIPPPPPPTSCNVGGCTVALMLDPPPPPQLKILDETLISHAVTSWTSLYLG